MNTSFRGKDISAKKKTSFDLFVSYKYESFHNYHNIILVGGSVFKKGLYWKLILAPDQYTGGSGYEKAGSGYWPKIQ